MTASGTSSRDRMAVAMRLGVPDRVPVMCQLSLGHYFLHSGLDPVDVWHGSPEFAEALVRLQQRYGFDGVLVNLPGRDPDWRRYIRRREQVGEAVRITWANGLVTTVPADDNPHVVGADGRQFRIRLDDVEPEALFYIEPHDLSGVTYPYSWGVARDPAEPGPGFFPPWHFDTIRLLASTASTVSIHGEVFSPFSQLLELLGYEEGLAALLDDPGKVRACLERLVE